MKALVIFTICLCLLSCQVDKQRVSLGKRVDNLEE